MKTVAVILAGGIGSRMGEKKPKQFLTVKGKPIIVYTLENFENSNRIDEILIVCVKGWFKHLNKLVEKYNLKKVKHIVEGGNTGHDSTRNAIFYLEDKLNDDDVVIIHDAARPLLPSLIINDMLNKTEEFGNASASLPCYETMLYTDDGIKGNKELDRKKVMRVQTPQAYKYNLLKDSYHKAEKENRHDFVYADLTVSYYGYDIYFSKGFSNNIKITTKEDIALFKSLLKFSEEELCSK